MTRAFLCGGFTIARNFWDSDSEESDGQRFVRLCKIGDIEGVQAAIDNGSNVNGEDEYDTTGLMLALGTSCNNVV